MEDGTCSSCDWRSLVSSSVVFMLSSSAAIWKDNHKIIHSINITLLQWILAPILMLFLTNNRRCYSEIDFDSLVLVIVACVLLPSFLALSCVLSAGPVDPSVVQDPSPAPF